MKRQVVIDIEEYEILLGVIKNQDKIIKELEKKSFIIHTRDNGKISYIENSPENISKIYNELESEVNKLEYRNRSEMKRKDQEITFLKMKLDSTINNFKTQVEEYNKQGGFGRMVYPFILKKL